MKGTAATSIASIFALAAFAIAIAAGLASGNPASAILLRAILAMLVCYPVGLAIGHVAQRLIHDHVEAHRQSHPPPQSTDDVSNGSSAPGPGDDEEVIVV
jgi:putative Mn2+ efflux pump MntP